MTRQGLHAALRDEIIAQRKHFGRSYKQIAADVGVTKGQVAGVLWRAGLCEKKESNADNTRTNAASAGGSQQT